MTTETNPHEGAEILTPQAFVERAVGMLGAASAAELEPHVKAQILDAFHLERCDDDWGRWLHEFDLPPAQVEQIHGMLVIRSSEVRTVAALLIGHECRGEEDMDSMTTFMTQ